MFEREHLIKGRFLDAILIFYVVKYSEGDLNSLKVDLSSA